MGSMHESQFFRYDGNIEVVEENDVDVAVGMEMGGDTICTYVTTTDGHIIYVLFD